MKRWAAVMAFVLLLASVIFTGAVGMGEALPAAAAFSDDWRVYTELSGGVNVAFTPPAGGLYDIFLLGDVRVDRAAILLDGVEIVSGGGSLKNVELEAGTEYVLTASGEGECTIELMRHTAGRSMTWPASIGSAETNGFIARPGSVFWYSLKPAGKVTGIFVSPEAGLELKAEVYTADGRLVAAAQPAADGGCYVFFEPEENAEYRIRLWPAARAVGKYTIHTAMSGDDAPESIALSVDTLSLREGDMRSLRVVTDPEDVQTVMFWASADPSVADVTGDGVITAVSQGSTRIYVYGPEGIETGVQVEVRRVEPEYMAYLGDFVSVRVGDVLKPSMQVYPAAAADDGGIEYVSDTPDIVSISETGEITALREGDAVITASYGGISTSMHVRVDEAPPRYRALLVSEQNYGADVNSVRVGAVNTAYNLESLFANAAYDGEKCAVTVEVDLTAKEMLEAIENTFAGAAEQDISILYISCHGFFESGMTMMQFVDGSVLAACDLELALRKIPGTIVLLADFCDSGGLIGGVSGLAGGVVSAFAGEESAFLSSKYKVIASTSMGQDSYRLGYADDGQQAITVFAWALCDAMGWDVEAQRRGALSADTDYDGQITLWEAYLYTERRVMWYLSRAGGGISQQVRVYPEGDMFVLFERE